MYLYNYIGKNVKVETNDGKVFEGRAIGVDDDDDNESGYYSLNIKTDKENGIVYDLNENEIESIEVIE
ncbi:LSM domain protein [Staphylococcus caeli]|uniref:LSM domain protein n=1 Tax=Staphylococcus caeli TaxID=2201815 RepID=UPI003F547F81